MTKGRLITLCALFMAMMLSCSKKDKGGNEPQDPPVEDHVKAVQETLAAEEDLKAFSDAFTKVNIPKEEAAEGLTVFAPVNEAVEHYDPNARVRAEQLTEEEVKDHIVKGIVKLADLTSGKKLISISGKVLLVSVENDKIYINGAQIGEAKEDTTGVVFIINKVLSDKPGKLEITVYDGTQWSPANPDGKPAAFAKVELYYNANDFYNGEPVFTGETDTAGKIVFDNLPEGDYYLVTQKGDKLNYFSPKTVGGKIQAFVAAGIYQNQQEISEGSIFPNTAPGDFKFVDGNADGLLRPEDDRVEIPFQVPVYRNQTQSIKSYIGYTLNSLGPDFQDKAALQQALDDVYTSVGNWHIQQAVMDGILTDDADCSGLQTYCELDNFAVIPNNSIVTNFWKTGYNNIGALNRIILQLPLLGLPPSEANLIEAEAKALRGYIYLQLATYFGGLPVQEGVTLQANAMRESPEATYDFIKNELEAASQILPMKWIGADARKIGASACKLLLARIAAAEKNFSQVAQYSTDIIQSSNYTLVDAAEIFTSASNNEIIWKISPNIPQQFSAFFSGKSFLPVLRYSEALLLNTEANIQNGYPDLDGLNMVRARRGQEAVSYTTLAQVYNELRNTWKNEHSREGQRFPKLIQWEMAETVLGPNYVPYKHNVLPIPQVVIDEHEYMTQNPGY
jgi:Secreted and surface protein containing fasciclin-like repeats